jgi:hypothetical protein
MKSESLGGIAGRSKVGYGDAIGLAVSSEVNGLILLKHHATKQNAFTRQDTAIGRLPEG